MGKWRGRERLGVSSTEWGKRVELADKIPFIEPQLGAGSRGFDQLSMRA
jgi:hypothetical protein